MNGSVLLSHIHFRHIFFRGQLYDKSLIINAIDHLAKYLTTHIRSTSPFILLSSYNHIKTLIAYYAILKAGKIVAILDPECRSLELSEIIEDIDPAAILFLNTSTMGFRYEEEVIFRKPTPGFFITSDLTDVCTISYTNAEDGYSKAAMLTENNLLTEIEAIIKANQLDEQSVTFSLLPFSHLYGMVQGILITTQSGGTGVITELNMLKIKETLDEIQKYKVTHVYSVPSVYYILSKCENINYSLNNLKMFISGGNKLSPFIFESFYKKTKHLIHEGYGLTETSPACTFNSLDNIANIDSVGKPLAGSDIRIFDKDDKECALNQIGEICIKGNLIFKGYFNNQKATDMVMKNGWFHTGDYGKTDKDGYIYFCGLKKNMINVAGNKAYPRKLERMIKAHKNVIDVKIFSGESILQGQTICSKIILKDTSTRAQDKLKKWCLKNMNNMTLPKVWDFE